MDELQKILIDSQREYAQSNRVKDKIVVMLIIIILIESMVIGAFMIYESSFDIVDTQTTTETVTTTEDIDVSSEGENASASYNNVEGNQYNDNATHNEDKGGGN